MKNALHFTCTEKVIHSLQAERKYQCGGLLILRALDGICKVSRNMGGAHPHLKIFVNNYAGCLLKMGMNEVQIRQRLEAVLKPYGFSADDS